MKVISIMNCLVVSEVWAVIIPPCQPELYAPKNVEASFKGAYGSCIRGTPFSGLSTKATKHTTSDVLPDTMKSTICHWTMLRPLSCIIFFQPLRLSSSWTCRVLYAAQSLSYRTSAVGYLTNEIQLFFQTLVDYLTRSNYIQLKFLQSNL